MKQLILAISFLLLYSIMGISQSYDRVGMTIIHTSYSDSYSASMANYYDSYTPKSRYDVNTIPTKEIFIPGSRLFENTGISLTGQKSYKVRTMEPTVTEQVNNLNIGKQIIAYLFNRQESGIMDMNLIHQRGEYNASDEDYNISAASKRGAEALKEAGESLISNTYFTVIDHVNVRYEYVPESNVKKGSYYYLGAVVGYLYKIEWSDELLNNLWDCWVDEDSSPEEATAKKAAFDSLTVPISFVSMYTSYEYAIDTKVGVDKLTPEDVLKANALEEFVNKGIELCFYEFEKKNDNLALTASLYDTKPLRAKLGTKEGLKTDNAFFVYEYVAGNNDEIKLRRKGLIKATKNISDNSRVASGDFEPSEFYQYTGGKLEAGLTLKEKKLFNIGLQAGITTGAVMTGFNVGLEMDFYSKKHLQTFLGVDANIASEAAAFGIYAGYGYRISNFQIYPLAGVIYDTLFLSNLSDEESKDNYAIGCNVGLKANYYIYFPFAIFAKVAYNIGVMEGDTYDYYKGSREITGANISLGARWYF